MSATPMYNKVAAQAALDAILALINVGGAGVIKIFTGSMPANCETVDTGTLLSTLTPSVTAFPASIANASPAGAKATANAVTSDTDAAATGIAGYFRVYPHTPTTTNAVLQGNVGTSAADMILNTVSIVQHATVSCTSWTETLPNGA